MPISFFLIFKLDFKKRLIPLLVLIAALYLKSFDCYHPVVELKSVVRKPWKYLQKEYGYQYYSAYNRPFFTPLVAIIGGALYPIIVFYFIDSLMVFYKNPATRLPTLVTLIIGQLLYTIVGVPFAKDALKLEDGKNNFEPWRVYKSLLTGSVAVLLTGLALTNPSLCILFSIVLVPLLFWAKPQNYFIYSLLGMFSPPCLLMLFENMTSVVEESFEFYHMHDNYFVVLVLLLYWPSITACQVLITTM